MRSRNLLHSKDVERFKQWLIDKGYKLEKPKGFYEILRWKGNKGKPMPMVFRRYNGAQVHVTTNVTAEGYVRAFIREKRNNT